MMEKRWFGFLSPFGRRSEPRSLYETVGGEAAIEELVELLYRKVLEDERLERFFADVCMHYQRYKLRIFLTMALGGPLQFTGKDLREAHAKLVRDGLDDAHFDRLIGHLRETLESLQLSAQQVEDVLAVTESTRNDVLGR